MNIDQLQTDSVAIAAEPEWVQLKNRMVYTRWLIYSLIPVVLFTATRQPEHSLTHEAMQWLGHILVLTGVMIRIYASLYVGGRKNNELVSDGPFSIVRNPLYVGSFVAVLGLGLLTTSATITAMLMLAFLLCYKVTVEREELYLRKKFGVRYERYSNRVPRWLPKPSLWQNPAEMNVKPYFVLRTILDGSLFFLAIPVLETVCELRIQGVLPTFLTLP